MQHRLCVYNEDGYYFRCHETFEELNARLKELFLTVFTAMESWDYLNGRLSLWLICSKQCGHNKGVIVFSNDSRLPNGLDIITASQNGKARSNYNEGILFIGA